MRMVQPSIHEIIDVVPVRHSLVPAGRAMRVLTARLRRALLGIGGSYRDDVFIYMVLVHVVEMAIMEIIDVAVMEDRRMPTVGTMLVSMVGMMFLSAGGHSALPSRTAVCGMRRPAISRDLGYMIPFRFPPDSGRSRHRLGSCARHVEEEVRPAHQIEQTIA
jgi:hypothetical protein